ncbi:hypothetical protein BaRGS_00014731 [Batillaria attramentaria]|uniref:Uncharacterized protein n=1 Tax=Batillaria attramentaria TaxID=370345 RepID=A0ABD0L4D1_9CAEN
MHLQTLHKEIGKRLACQQGEVLTQTSVRQPRVIAQSPQAVVSRSQVSPAVQQVIQPIPASPATQQPTRIITVRTPAPGQTQVPIPSTPATPISNSALPTVRVVQSTNPQGTRTPVTKVIRVASNSLLQRTPGGTSIVGAPIQNGSQRTVHRVVAPGTRVVAPSAPIRGGTPGQPHIITITRVNPSTGATASGTTLNAKNVITVGPQGTTTSVGAPTRKIFVTRNGQTIGPITTTVNVANVTRTSQILSSGSSGQQVIISANGHRQVMRVASPVSVTAAPTTTAPSGAGVLQITSVPEQQPAAQTRILQAGSLGQLSSVLRSGSPVQIISKSGLSGGNVITVTTTSPSLHYSPSAPVLSNHVSMGSNPSSRSSSPGLGIGSNIPTVVQQQLGGGGAGLPVRATVTSKDISRMWSTEDMRRKVFAQAAKQTYADYMPSKLRVGEKHPDPVVETSSLSSVEPPDVHYRLSVPESVMDSCLLSALQLEAIVYASQRQNTILPSGERAGYLIGDGAGVGKGRTVAGIIYENYLLGRKRALWLSVSNDLKVDAERDLRDIGAGKIEVYPLNKFKYAKISSKENGSVKKGVIFATYSSLIGESQSGGKYRTRLKQLLKWCGKDFDGVIVFDECHKAKNLCPTGSSKPTKTGQTVLELQNRLPKARVVYASATGASEPKNMAYMTRLGLWGPGTPFKEFNDFIQAVERRGVGAMELVAMDMKLRGMYIARQLSFHGVSFHIEEIPLDAEFKKVYDESVDLWMEARSMFQKAADLIQAEHRMRKSMWGQFWSAHQRFFKYLCISAKVMHCVSLAREAVKSGKCVVIGLQSTGEARTLEQVEELNGELNDFVSTAKGVFQTVVEKHFPAPDRRKTFDMLGLSGLSQRENTDSMDSFSLKRKRESDISSSAKRSKNDSSDDGSSDSSNSDFSDLDLSETSESDSDGNDNPFGGSGSDSDEGMDVWEKAFSMKAELLNLIERLGDKLPPNTLDQLIDELGGPENVAEMTGRKGRVVQSDEGIQYESRSESDVPLEILNLTEKQRFMDGEKNVAIISEAASSGISLQADRRAVNQKRRVHITLELPWSADRAIQQFGRTHRSNQVSAPEYVFLISELAGERRFAATVAKRLESLGALTHGDRRATESRDLSRFNIDNRYGRAALESVMKSVLSLNGDQPFVAPPKSYKGNFFKDVKMCLEGVGLISTDEKTGVTVLEKDYNNISKFLNRLLGMPVDLQNAMFDYFNNTLTTIILDAKRSGRWDMGILDLGSGQERVKKMETKVFVGNTATNTAKTELSTVVVERGMSWMGAMDIWRRCKTMEEGFYISLQERNLKRTAILVVLSGKNKKREKVYSVYRPNTGLQTRAETLDEIKKKYKKVLPDNAQKCWEDQYIASAQICTHAYWQGNCKKVSLGLPCEIGLRTRQYHVLSGSVLSVWSQVEAVLAAMPGSSMSKMQIIRLRTDDGQRIVGSLIPNNCVPPLINVLSKDSARTYTEKHEQSLEAAVNGLKSFQASTPSSNRNHSIKKEPGMMSASEHADSPEPEPEDSRPSQPVLSMPMFDFM